VIPVNSTKCYNKRHKVVTIEEGINSSFSQGPSGMSLRENAKAQELKDTQSSLGVEGTLHSK
jgi:hypothetical protein